MPPEGKMAKAEMDSGEINERHRYATRVSVAVAHGGKMVKVETDSGGTH